MGFHANKWKSSNLSGRQKHEMPENLLNNLNPKYIWVGKNLMNILINYSMNIFSKWNFPTFRIRISNRSWIFGALEHAEMYINDFLVWYFIFQRIFESFSSENKKMRFECLILIFIGSAMGFRRFWRHYHDGGRINRIIFVGWPIMIRIKLKFWSVHPFFRRWFFDFIQYRITKPCAWWERWWC